jgi:hypothetical protein
MLRQITRGGRIRGIEEVEERVNKEAWLLVQEDAFLPSNPEAANR